MPDCKICLEENMEARPARYVKNGVPVCDEHFASRAAPAVDLPAPKVEPLKKVDWDEVRAEITKERAAGIPARVLAKRYGVAEWRIYQNAVGPEGGQGQKPKEKGEMKMEAGMVRKKMVDASKIDWEKVKKDRAAGTKMQDLTKKYDCSAFTIYKYTNPVGSGNPVVRSKEKAPKEIVSNGFGYFSVALIANLKSKRDSLNKVIELMESF